MGCRHGLDLALLCLWCRPAAVVPIRPLAWDPPYALKRQKTKRQKKKKKKKKKKERNITKRKKEKEQNLKPINSVNLTVTLRKSLFNTICKMRIKRIDK